MKNEEITAIAREYAEWVTDVSKAEELPNCLLNEANKLIADSAERMLTWLSTRYCLVEKEAVRKEFHEIELALGDGGRSEWEDDINMEKEALLKSLFTDLGKEMEE